tara:strand:+ start:8056 stop:9498 length:1443 start_codon:yes stop_codon:yes gene_type:complete
MADQGILGQLKPGNSLATLYSAPINASASAVLNVVNDGTGAAYDAAIKDYDQELTLDASTYKLHKGDIISGYRVAVNTPITAAAGFFGGQLITTDDGEKKFNWESFYVPPTTTIYIKDVLIRQISIESVTGTFEVGQTVSTGTSPNDTVATVFGKGENVIFIGPSTINGSGAEFAAGDSLTSSGSATATISSGGIATGVQEFVFSSTTAGGTYDLNLDGTNMILFSDRVYRFDVSDGSMASKDFKFSTTVNGEWGPDNTAGNSDDGTEFTTGKTTNGTAGSGGAYIQYDFSQSTTPTTLYFYEGTTGTAANSAYGGTDRQFQTTTNVEYTEFYIYEKDGTLVNSTDTFTVGGTTYTITGQTAGPIGYVRSYSGTTLRVIKGTGSADFAGSDTFQDVPASNTATRSTVTVSSVDVATAAVGNENYIIIGKSNSANNIDKTTSVVIGPGERLLVKSATANNAMSFIGFEDASTALPTRVFGS